MARDMTSARTNLPSMDVLLCGTFIFALVLNADINIGYPFIATPTENISPHGCNEICYRRLELWIIGTLSGFGFCGCDRHMPISRRDFIFPDLKVITHGIPHTDGIFFLIT